jgi:hypothetical protein
MDTHEHAAQAAPEVADETGHPPEIEREPVEKIPAWKVFLAIGAFIGTIMLIAWIVELASDDGAESSWRVSGVSVSNSPGGRIEVSFSVANTGTAISSPECRIRALDGDGFTLGADIVDSLTPVEPGSTERYNVLTGIGAAGVAKVAVACE